MLHVPHIKALAMAYLSRTDNKDIHALQTMRNILRVEADTMRRYFMCIR